jgi:hypothetical protein
MRIDATAHVRGFSFVAFVIVATGCGTTSSVPPPVAPAIPLVGTADIVDPTVWQDVPASLTQPQRLELAHLLDAMPRADRASVVVDDPDGSVYTNDPAVPLESDLNADIAGPDTAAPNDASAGTGPIVRREEPAGSGHTWFSAQVTLPCASTMLQAPEGGAFIYSSFYAPDGTQTEQGFDIHTPGTIPQTPTSIFPYWRQGPTEVGYNKPVANPHYTCDQTVTLRNYISQASAAATPIGNECITGVFLGDHRTKTTCFPHAMKRALYQQICASCYMRWLGGIAFGPPVATGHYVLPRTYFAVDQPQSQRTESGTLTWTNVRVGTFTSIGAKAIPTVVPWSSGGRSLAPSNGLTTGVLTDHVTSTNPWNETMGFDLYFASEKLY